MEFPWAVASLSSGEVHIPKVGLRYKGNATYGMSAKLLKRPLKIDLNRQDADARFYGEKTLNLNCGVFDPSRYRETLAYSIYQSAGVPAPRTALAEVTLTVPGRYDRETLGAYTLVEDVDKSFLKTHFGSSAGLLMKPEKIPLLAYLGDDWERYRITYLPKREATPSEQKRVISLAKLVYTAPDAQFRAEIPRYLDIDAYLRFIGVTALLSNLDGVHSGHNFYLYLHPETQKFHFVPWDLDVSLGGFPFLREEDLVDLSLVKPYPGQCRLTDRLMEAGDIRARYLEILREIVPVCFSQQKLQTQLEQLEKILQPVKMREQLAAASRGETKPPAGDKEAELGPLGRPIPNLKSFLLQRTSAVAKQLRGESTGTVPSALDTQVGAVPREAPRQLIEAFGTPFLIFHPKVPAELALSPDQKKQLDRRLAETVQRIGPFFQSLENVRPEERPQKMQAAAAKERADLERYLQGVLQPEQTKRLQQLMLQREGLFSLGNPDIQQQMQMTDTQRRQFFQTVQQMQQRMQAVFEELQRSGQTEQAQARIAALRRETMGRLDALLTSAQKRIWAGIIGRQADLDD